MKAIEPNLERISCPLCAGESEEFLFEGWDRIHGVPGRFRVVRCLDCTLVYINPRPDRESMSLYYPPNYFTHKKSERITRRWKDRVRTRVLKTYFHYPCEGEGKAPGFMNRLLELPLYLLFRMDRRNSLVMPYQGTGRFLDVGCGGGRVLRFMKDKGWDVSGVEIDSLSVKNLSSEFRVFEGELVDCPWEESSFDVVHMSHVLEHFHDPVETVKKANRLLAKGGRLYLKIPDGGGFGARRYKSHWIGLDVPRHLCTFTRKTAAMLLEKTGFTVEYIKGDRNFSSLKRSCRLLAQEKTTPMTLLARVKPVIRGMEELAILLGGADSMIVCARKD